MLSSTYHKLIKALDGSPKMSKRNPMSYFTLNEPSKVIEKKIFNAFNGGCSTAKEQRALGANPNICPIFDLYLFHFYKDDNDVLERLNECLTGDILCGECKSQLIGIVKKFIEKHQAQREKFLDKAMEIIIVD